MRSDLERNLKKFQQNTPRATPAAAPASYQPERASYYILFSYKPMYGALMAFFNYKPARGFSGSEFVGLQNFIEFFKSPFFARTIKNTLAISVLNLIFCFPAPIILALLLNEVRNAKCITKIRSRFWSMHTLL